MPNFDILDLVTSFQRRLNHVPRVFSRFLLGEIDWEDRLIGIRGVRGCGKTTMLLQRILGDEAKKHKSLYASLDHLWFSKHSLEELAEYHVSHGGTHLYLDEVHYLDNWQTSLKNLYDDFPELQIVYTGSSLLKIDFAGGDLSRRQIVYNLPGLSFREFIELEDGVQFPTFSLEDIVSHHAEIATSISSKISILAIFEKYLKYGYYPFYREVRRGFDIRLQQIVNQVLESDYPATESVTVATIRKTRKMLQVLSESVPQTPNLNELCVELETDRNQALKMLDALARAGLLGLLMKASKNLKRLGWPEKILMHNTNLMYALGTSVLEGTLRETFFLNQLQVGHQLHLPEKGDFLVDGKYLFEVGGRRKSFRQIQDIADSYLAVDDLEVGYGNRIPLWLFGFLY
jgi:predicted AAA+ superfamily ATPase